MNRFDLLLHSMGGRALSLFLAWCLTAPSCNPGGGPLGVVSGIREYQQLAFVDVPHGRVNTAGGNFVVRRVDLSIDTRLGTREIGATYNSQSGLWTWSFDLFYDGAAFVDATEARFEVAEQPDGSALPGSHWVKVNATAMKTRGGLLHVFDPASAKLDHVRWTSSDYPRLRFLRTQVAGATRISRVEQCKTQPGDCSVVYDVSYDSLGRVAGLVDRAGRTTLYAYDVAGLLATARDALDIEQNWPGQRYEYAGTRLAAITNSEGERTEYSYVGRRLVSATQIGAGDPTHRLEYSGADAGIHTTRVIDPTGSVSVYRYDKLRRVQEQGVESLGEMTHWLWSGLRPTQQTDPAGVVRSWTWLNDDLMSETTPAGSVLSYQYAPTAVDREMPHRRPISSVTDSLGVVEQRNYDGAGRLVLRANGAGDSVTWAYKSNHMVDTVARADGVTASYAGYGETGHPTRIEVGGVEQVRSFDAVGNRVSGPGAAGESPGVVSRRFDGDRNLVEVVVGDSSLFGSTTVDSIELEYRSDGKRTAIRRPYGGDHEFGYDALGQALSARERVDGTWRTTILESDPLGRPIAQQRPNGMRIEWERDAAGRVVRMRGLRGGTVESDAVLIYSQGRLASIEDSKRNGDDVLVYDTAGRISAIGHPDGEASVFQYDIRGRRTRELFYDAQFQLVADLISSYDAADRRTSVSNGSDPLVDTSYVDGQLSETTYGNGLVRRYAYDELGELSDIEMRDATGALVESSTIQQGILLNTRILTARTESFGGLTQLTEEIYQLNPNDPALDANGMVGRRVSGWAAAAGGALEAMPYDVLGNLAAIDAHAFGYNAERNRLLSVDSAESGTIDYAYDHAGFVTSRQGVSLSWTALGQLASRGPDVFEWDSLGRMIASTHQGVATHNRWAGRITAAPNGTPLALDGGDFRLDLLSATERYRHFDFRGNVKLVSDEAGEIVTQYRYRPHRVDSVFGEASDDVRFVGRPEIGDLMILGARIYDPEAGIFLSPDPILNVINQYAYTLGNPVEFTDRDGLTGLAGYFAGVSTGVGSGLVANAATTAIGAAVAGTAVVTAPVVITGGLGIIFILFGFGLFYYDAGLPTDPTPLPQPDPGESESGDSSATTSGGGGGSGGCSSPAALAQVPYVSNSRSGWLWFLLPLQLLLGVALLRRRHDERWS